MTDWPAAPEPLPPLGGDIHVWAVDINDPGFDANRRLARLAVDELERADRFKFARDRRQYLVAHVALRTILGAYLRCAGDTLQFSKGANGKPRLAETAAQNSLEFNLAHSHERALIAVGQARIVGVDVEYVRSDFGFHEVAGHFFTKREVAALTALPLALQRRAFYKCWTSKEAFLKAKGVGLSGALDEVEIVHDRSSRVGIRACVPGWSLTDLDPGGRYEGALVVEGGPAPILCYRWAPVR